MSSLRVVSFQERLRHGEPPLVSALHGLEGVRVDHGLDEHKLGKLDLRENLPSWDQDSRGARGAMLVREADNNATVTTPCVGQHSSPPHTHLPLPLLCPVPPNKKTKTHKKHLKGSIEKVYI